jgi:NADPH:quinone reductase
VIGDRVPDSMRVVCVQTRGGPVHVARLPVPRPGPGEVLVRIAAAPVNPSDLGVVDGHYGRDRRLPLVPGNEGSGTVVAAGAGTWPRVLLGRRVACAATAPHGGTWAEYMVTKATRCVPLRRTVDLERGATLLVNPLSALGLIEAARRGRHRAVVSTAAAGALGKMILRLARRYRLPVIAVVRREEQRAEVRAEGAHEVVVSTSDDFVDRLREAAHELRATLLLDAVGGEMTGQLLAAAPEHSTVLIYGALSYQALVADPRSLLAGDRRVEGFLLATWARRKGLLGLTSAIVTAQRLVGTDLATLVRERVDLEEVPEALARYRQAMGAGKVLIVPKGA